MENRVFPGRGGIELAAERVKNLGYLRGAEPGAALEQEVLDKVTDAALRRRLVAGTRSYPEAQRNGTDRGQLLTDDPAAALQLLKFILLDLSQPP